MSASLAVRGRSAGLALLACATAAASFLFPQSALAQTVVGVVQEAGTGHPVAGALIRLEDEQGAANGLFITDSDGRFSLQARAGGTFHLLVERIGYGASRHGPVVVPAARAVVRNIIVDADPVSLDGFTVQGETRGCEASAGDGGRTAIVWDQVRKALDASSWTAREQKLSFDLRRWERVLDPRRMTIVEERESRAVGAGENSVRSLAPEDLAQDGYVRASGDEVSYFAPDAEAMLSPSFLSAHCFSLRAEDEDDDPRFVGLNFEPLPSRDTTDIEGTFWVERSSGRLDRVDFAYTGLAFDVEPDAAGGRLEYAELPDGRWVIREWFIRAPAARLVRSSTAFGTRERVMIQSVYETGSRVVSVRGQGFDWSADEAVASLDGAVFDSTRARPLAGATVRVAGRAWRATADSSGAFALEGLPVGRYRVLFEHPRLDSLGLPPRGADIELLEGANRVALTIPGRGTLLAEACPDRAGHVVVGRVLAPDSGTPVSGASVAVMDPASDSSQTTVSGVDGYFRMCNISSTGSLSVVAFAGDSRSDPVALAPSRSAGEHSYVDLTVAWGGVAEVSRTSALDVVGAVLDATNGRPVPGALIEAVDAAGAVVSSTLADEAGAFRLSLDRRGEVMSVRFSSLGYIPALSDPLPPQTRRYRLSVELSPEALTVEGVVVAVEGGTLSLDRLGYYDRERASGGTFLEVADLEGASMDDLSGALLRLPGVQRFASVTTDVSRQRIQLRGAIRASGSQTCAPAVYVDGRMARWGATLGEDGPSSGYPTLDDLVRLSDVIGVEVYDTPSTIPPQFAGPGSLCGVIVIWTHASG